MVAPRAFKLPLIGGMQTVRLDPDSVDYDWRGMRRKFHGTLPYENLRLMTRVTRKERGLGPIAILVALLFLSLLFVLRPQEGDSIVRAAGLALIVLLSAFMRQLLSPGTICLQIEPQPFGFRGEFPIPDTRQGKAFLAELEEAWKDSLCRRFLIRDASWLKRIDWLESIGAITGEEAAAERSLAKSEHDNEPELIGQAELH